MLVYRIQWCVQYLSLRQHFNYKYNHMFSESISCWVIQIWYMLDYTQSSFHIVRWKSKYIRTLVYFFVHIWSDAFLSWFNSAVRTMNTKFSFTSHYRGITHVTGNACPSFEVLSFDCAIFNFPWSLIFSLFYFFTLSTHMVISLPTVYIWIKIYSYVVNCLLHKSRFWFICKPVNL